MMMMVVVVVVVMLLEKWGRRTHLIITAENRDLGAILATKVGETLAIQGGKSQVVCHAVRSSRWFHSSFQ
jgi:hypothetical protein